MRLVDNTNMLMGERFGRFNVRIVVWLSVGIVVLHSRWWYCPIFVLSYGRIVEVEKGSLTSVLPLAFD